MKIYFASDVHLGYPPKEESAKREKLFVKWLDEVSKDATEIYLLGDIFDFWFEYKLVVPKGFVRTLGKLAEITDSGIPVHFFIGNHDIWVKDYLTQELGVIVHYNGDIYKFGDKTLYLGHGDAVDKTDKAYQRLRKIFTNSFLRKMYASLHPRIGIGIAHKWSHNSRLKTGLHETFRGESEGIYKFVAEESKNSNIDYFVMGHRHIALDMQIGKSKLIILGEWLTDPHYAVFDGNNIELKSFEK